MGHQKQQANSGSGWSYPAGAENDSRAPYNQIDFPDDIPCPECDESATFNGHGFECTVCDWTWPTDDDC